MSLSDVLDDAADEAVAGRALDPAAIVVRAQRPEYRPPLRPLVGLGAPRWRAPRGLPRRPLVRGLLVAASLAAVATLLLALLPVVQRAVPLPATTPKAPGGIPRTISTPLPWVPTVTEQPISRAVYVAAARVPSRDEEAAGISPAPAMPWLVGADGGQYRTLPETVADGGQVRGVALSPDGTRVAWTSDSRYGDGSRLDVVDIPTGAQRTLLLVGSGRRGVATVGLAFSPDGAYVALWGDDDLGPHLRMPRLIVVDAARGRVAQQPCDLDTSDAVWGAAWLPSAAPPRLVTRGCTVGARSEQGAPATGVVVVGTGLPPTPSEAAQVQALGTPTGADSTGPVLGMDGATRWTVVARPLDDSGSGPGDIQRFSLDPTGRVRSGWEPVDLGAWAGAIALAAVPDGVLVTRWSTGPRFPSGHFGPSELVLARPDGTVDTITTSGDDQARVAAVASAVVSVGRPVDGTDAGPRLLDPAWWSWQAGGAVHRVASWSDGGTWVLVSWVAVPIVAVPLLRRGLTALVLHRRRRRAVTESERATVDAPLPRAVRHGPVLLVVVVAVVSMLLPQDAPRVAAPTGPLAPVLPRVLGDQPAVPQLAFDTVGAPRTTAVGLVFQGTVAGRPGLYATDAATGAVVRLDDLPGLGVSVGGWWPTNVAVSPNGRWLSNGGVVVDLATARWGQIPGAVPIRTVADRVAANTAVLDDGSVVLAGVDDQTLWVYPPPTSLPSRAGRVPSSVPRGTRVAGVEGAVTVTSAGPGRVVVGVANIADPGAPDKPSTAPTVLLVDVGSPGSGASLAAPVVTPLSTTPGAVVAVLGGSRVDGDADGWRQEPLRPLRSLTAAGQRVATAGAVDALWLAAPAGAGTGRSLVALGAGPTADLVVSRTPIPAAGDAGVVSVLTTIDPAVVPVSAGRLSATSSVVAVAAEVVAAARVVEPPPASRWWSWAFP